MLTLIAAIASNSCIGKDNALPWRLPEDMKRFKELTTGHTVLMGRKTWESIPQKFRPLPDRKNVVITRQTDYAVPEGVEVHGTIQSALARHTNEHIFVIGGAEIYAQTIGIADRLEITHVDQTVDGDAYFPQIDPAVWKEVAREVREGFSFVTYERASG